MKIVLHKNATGAVKAEARQPARDQTILARTLILFASARTKQREGCVRCKGQSVSGVDVMSYSLYLQ